MLKMLQASVILILFGWAQAVNDPKIFDVRHVNSIGTVSFPIFSADGRFILFQSKTENDLTSCSRIYQVDLNNPDKDGIGLYSSGIGDEFRPTIYDWYNYYDTSFVTTNTHWLKTVYSDKNKDITPNSFCTKSKCDSPTDPDLQKACTSDILAYTEHYDYTTVIHYNYNGLLHDGLEMASGEANTWKNPSQRLGSRKYVESGSCVYGECVLLNDTVEINSYLNKDGAAFDGFSFNPYYDQNPKEYFFFHGYIATVEWQKQAIAKGVTPTTGSKIYRSTFENITYGLDPDHLVKNTDKLTYLWPQFTKNERQAIATGIDPDTKKAAIYLLELDKDPILLSDPSVNSYHAILDPTGQYIAFVSDRTGRPEIYIGKYMDSRISNPNYSPTAPVEATWNISKALQNYLSYSNPSKPDTLFKYKSTKFSKDGNELMYTASPGYEDCPQIYIFNMNKNDTTSLRRKIGSGFHIHNSPSFIVNTDTVLFGSTLTHKYDDSMLMSDCREHVCTDRNPNKSKSPLKDICDGVKEKPLPSDMELYISNKYGIIQKRLTFHDGFDGEAAVSPDGSSVIYSSFTGSDYDLFQMDIDGKNQKKITNVLGFEGGVTFSPDGKFIAYYASRPTKQDEVNKYKQMMKYEFTNINQTEIYVYSFGDGKEYQLSNFGDKSCHSPAFMQKGSDKWSYRLVFIAEDRPGIAETKMALHGALFNAPKNSKIGSRVVFIDSVSNEIWDLNVHEDMLVFSTKGDIGVLNKFDPDFSNAFTLKASGFVLFVAFFLVKFL